MTMTSPLAAVVATVLSLALLSPRPGASAFSAPAASSSRRCRAVVPPLSATTTNRGGGKKEKKGKKQQKRRFSQLVHPAAPPPSVDLGGPAVGGGSAATAADEGNAKPSPSADGGAGGRGPPLRSGKSIEELESILEGRWGATTAAPKRSGGGDDGADFVLSFGGDGDESDDPPSRTGSPGASGKDPRKDKRPRRRNRAVDPWAREERVRDDAPRDDAPGEDAPGEDARGGDGAGVAADRPPPGKRGYDRREAMLDRVRSNQERWRSGRKGDGPKGEGAVAGGPRGGPADVPRDGRDGGRGGRGSGPASPRPNGGRGSSSGSPSFSAPSSSYVAGGNADDGGRRRSGPAPPRPDGGEEPSPRSSLASSSLAGGIFSVRSPADAPADRRDRGPTADVPTRPARPKAPPSRPVLDEDGSEALLTLERAGRAARALLPAPAPGAAPPAGWEDAGVTHPALLSNLKSKRMSCPAPLAVQAKACPAVVGGDDVLVSTHTGSGKTLAFLAPVAQRLLAGDDGGASNASPRAVVVVPGRELAGQVVAVARDLLAGTGLTAALAIGGTPYGRNVDVLRKKKPDVVVGTPGRIAELVVGRPGEKSGKLKISGLQTIVLDEFDALLRYDAHKEPTLAILQALDRQHGRGGSLQRVLCSATASDMMTPSPGGRGNDGSGGSSVVGDYLRPGYVHASVDDGDQSVTPGVRTETKDGVVSTSARVSRATIHGTLHVPHQRLALEAVRKILNTQPSPQQVLIFVDSQRRVDIVIEKLAKMDIIAAPLHGGAGKGDRAQVSKALREGYVGVVVATELAARGIDAPYLTHVINLDLPTDASHYAHRAGRCGRGGRPGVAVSVTCDAREKGVPRRFAEELGIEMHDVEAKGGKLRIIEGRG